MNINMALFVLNSTTLFPWISHDFMTFFVSLRTQSFVKVPSSKPISSDPGSGNKLPRKRMATSCNTHFFSEKTTKPQGFQNKFFCLSNSFQGSHDFPVTSSRKVGCDLLGSPLSLYTYHQLFSHQPFLVLMQNSCQLFPSLPLPNSLTNSLMCMPPQTLQYVYIYICVCIYIEIYIIHPISYQYIVLLPPQNPGTSRLKFVVPVKMAYVGLYQLLPRTNSKSLYMNASPRPMLQSISSHTGI